MQIKLLLLVCLLALLAVVTHGEASVAQQANSQVLAVATAVENLKAAVSSGSAPCAKGVSAPPKKRQYLDIRLPVVVDDYHPPVGGFNPSHIPSKEVDVAARKILREIQAHEKEQRENGDLPPAPEDNGILSTEEHKALKQLLLDSDILVRAAAKSLAENGPVTLNRKQQALQVAAAAVKKAARAEKKIDRLARKTRAPVAAAAAPAGANQRAAPAVPVAQRAGPRKIRVNARAPVAAAGVNQRAANAAPAAPAAGAPAHEEPKALGSKGSRGGKRNGK